jgi:uncharacterized protein (DUF849 family)
MGLFNEGRTMVRIAVNEMQPKSANPSVPYGPDEVAADAVECAARGASIIHFHSRLSDGSQALDDDRASASVYRQVMELAGAECDIIMEPTNLDVGDDPTVADATPHFWLLLENPPAGRPLEVVNIDGFRFAHKRARWDERTRRLLPLGRSAPAAGEVPFAGPEVIVRTVEAGLVPFFGLFDVADARILSAFALQGIIRTPVLVQLNFFWDLLRGPTPTVDGLDAFLHEWRRHDIDSEVCLFVRDAPDRETYEAILHAALDRGVHLRVGLGDNAPLFSTWTNADMTEFAADIASRHGLRPATPNELRARVGLAEAAVTRPAAST